MQWRQSPNHTFLIYLRKRLGVEVLPSNQNFPSFFSPHCSPLSLSCLCLFSTVSTWCPCSCPTLGLSVSAPPTQPHGTGSSGALPAWVPQLCYQSWDELWIFSSQIRCLCDCLLGNVFCQTTENGLVLVCNFPFVFIYFHLSSECHALTYLDKQRQHVLCLVHIPSKTMLLSSRHKVPASLRTKLSVWLKIQILYENGTRLW